MKRVIKYKCDYCGDLFDLEDYCIEHEDRHRRVYKANEMLKDGHTLKEIQNECNIWRLVPEYLEDVTIDNCFTVKHWQCCDKPAYQITYICTDGRVNLWGCGSWTGYYGGDVNLDSSYLKNPRSKEELFIDKRYGNSYGF